MRVFLRIRSSPIIILRVELPADNSANTVGPQAFSIHKLEDVTGDDISSILCGSNKTMDLVQKN